MNYKYSRKVIAENIKTYLGLMHLPYEAQKLAEDLLAQKEDKKECIHEGDTTNWHPQFCRKCGAEFMYDFTTPSPLEIEEIEEITGVYRDIGGGVSYTQKNKKVDENLSVLINQLISNQKKLYQLIKEKL